MEKSENTIASRRDAANKAEMAFKVFDKVSIQYHLQLDRNVFGHAF
jgi:hypothetical protein